MMKTLLIYLLLALGAGMGCKKQKPDPEEGLTKATQTGANTFSCKVNGQIFMPNQVLFGPKPISGYVKNNQEYTELKITANTTKNILQIISFSISRFTGKGAYALTPEFPNYCTVYFDAPIPNKETSQNGTLVVTRYDSEIISGTFEFSFNHNGQEYHVTFGRFDINLNTL